MTRHFVPLILALGIAGCSGPGTGTAERNAERNADKAAVRDSVQAAAERPQDAPVPPMPKRPEFRATKATGWESFDGFYDQLIKVVDLQVGEEGRISKDEFATLRERAQELEKDASPAAAASKPQRTTVAELVGRLVELPEAMPQADKVRMLQPVLMMTRDIALTVQGQDMGPQVERLQFASIEIGIAADRLRKR